MIAALVPVQRFGTGKTRLHLDAETSGALAQAMLEDLLEALAAVPVVDRIAVVTEDDAVANVVEAAGAQPILCHEEGLIAALDAATDELTAAGLSCLLIVLGDVAGALPGDLAALFRALDDLGGRGVVLAPSSDGGTCALLRSPPDAIALAFGEQSAARHRDRAQAAALPFREVELPSLAIDLDCEADIDAFLRTAKGGERTRALLRRMRGLPSGPPK